MKSKTLLAMLLFVGCVVTLPAQDKTRMTQLQERLSTLLQLADTATTDNRRYLASEQAVEVLEEALKQERSERWRWTLPQCASVLTSPDGRLRVFTWAVVADDGVYECFGAVQYYNDREEEYQYALLHDKSDDLINREESVLQADRWLGAIYQDIIQTTASGHTYYTLLGWCGVDNLTDRKVIEPVMIRGGAPQFGAPLFRRERNLRRIVLEYANDAMVHLAYEEQFVETVTRERVKVKGSNRYRTEDRKTVHKEKMIVFDEVEAQVPGMEGMFQYYVPSGTELAYAFVDGKWEQRQGAHGRLTDKKLNKPFEPLPKSAPAYKH